MKNRTENVIGLSVIWLLQPRLLLFYQWRCTAWEDEYNRRQQNKTLLVTRSLHGNHFHFAYCIQVGNPQFEKHEQSDWLADSVSRSLCSELIIVAKKINPDRSGRCLIILTLSFPSSEFHFIVYLSGLLLSPLSYCCFLVRQTQLATVQVNIDFHLVARDTTMIKR